MLFHEFVQKLSPVLRGGDSTAAFTKTIFEEIITEDNLDLLSSYKESSYKAFYNGNATINKLALKINPYIEPEQFSQFIMKNTDSVIENICRQFSEICPEIDLYNAGDVLAKLFAEIITEAAGNNKKSTQTGANTYKQADNSETTEPSEQHYVVNLTHKIIPSMDKIERAINAAMEATKDTPQGIFGTYLEKAYDYYSEKKTLLYTEKPRPFYDFYVCNDLKYHRFTIRDENYRKLLNPIHNATVQILEKQSKYIIIEGTGGIGKSMFLQHLFLSSVNDFLAKKENRLPVIIPLKDYKNVITDMTDFVWFAVKEYDSRVSQEQIISALEDKQMIILFDGLDEIPSYARNLFEKMMETFIKSYPGNTIIIASRPIYSFVSYAKFSVLDILPLTREQSVELIDKLEFWDSKAKQNFKNALKTKFYDSHREFASNPLLLTIMLMSYSTFGEIPAKMHVFFSQAYETMAQKHDATKGAYKRPFKTALSYDDFKKCFSEFCARTYNYEIFEFTETRFAMYMDKILEKLHLETPILSSDFLTDLKDNLCIIYKEGDKYYFIHRSFQEYFAALYFSTVYDSKLQGVGHFFNSMNERSYTDITFDMLYDMIPERVDRFIFYPFLKDMFQKWKGNGSEETYFNFLKWQYPVLYHLQGDTSCDVSNSPQDFLYQFIVNQKKIKVPVDLYNTPWPQDILNLPKKEWIEVYSLFLRNESYNNYPDPHNIPAALLRDTTIIEKPYLPAKYIGYFGKPEAKGFSIKIRISNLLKNPSKYDSLIKFITSDIFPLKDEFERLKKYYIDLNKRIQKENRSKSLFD